jgi:integrase
MEDKPSPTLAILFAQYQAEYLSDKSPVTRYQHQLFFRQVLRAVGDLPLVEVTPEVLRAWKTLLSQRHKPGTVLRYLFRLSAAFKVAVVDYGWLADNPLTRVHKPAPPEDRVRFLSPEELHRLLAACRHSPRECLYPLVMLALETGGRKNEVRKLRWSEVDLDGKQVRFLKTKHHGNRVVPLVGHALPLLQERAAARDPLVPWVFPNHSGTAPVLMERDWRAALAASGIKDFRFHDLRHTFASYMAMSGATLREIADVLGHKNIQQTMKYAHLLPSHTAAVVERMAAKFLQDPPPAP